MRILQIITDTADTAANLAALRHHRVLAGRGVEVRTLAIAPGRGTVVPRIVPTMAPSARSIAAFTQLRRELRWPDVVVAVDRIPRALRGRSTVPVVVVSATGGRRRELVAASMAEVNVRRVVVPAGDRTAVSDLQGLRTPYDPALRADGAGWSARRRAARTQLGLGTGDVLVGILDQGAGGFQSTRVVRGGSLGPVDDPIGSTGAAEVLDVLLHAVDVVVPVGSVAVDPPGCLPPVLVDLMVAGAVPVGWPTGYDDELLADGLTAVTSPLGRMVGDGDGPDDVVVELARDTESLRRLSIGAAHRARRLCDPDEIADQWSEILSEALPSLT